MAMPGQIWQHDNAMESLINIEENIGKTVGRRKLPQDGFAYGMALQETGNAFRSAFGHGGLCPKGVYRFKTHEEADAWTLKMLTQRLKK